MTRRILIADDHVPTRRDLQVFLQTQGFEVVAVGNGDLATRRAKEMYPEFIVLDFLMPGQTGYEACKYIRNTLNYKAPILIIYNDFEPFNREEALHAGADEVMAKPLDPFALLDTFNRLWKKYGLGGPDTGSFSLGEEEMAAFEPEIPVSDNVELPPPMNSMEMVVPAELRAAKPPVGDPDADDVSTTPDYEQSLPPEYRFDRRPEGPPTDEFDRELTDTLDDILDNLDELGPVVVPDSVEIVPQPTTNDWFSTPPDNEWYAPPSGELAQDTSIPPASYVADLPPPVVEAAAPARWEGDFSDVASEMAAEEAEAAEAADAARVAALAVETPADDLADPERFVTTPLVATCEPGEPGEPAEARAAEEPSPPDESGSAPLIPTMDVAVDFSSGGAEEPVAASEAPSESAEDSGPEPVVPPAVSPEPIPEVVADARPSSDSLADSYSVVASGFYASYFEDESGKPAPAPFTDPYPSRNMFAPLPAPPVDEMDFAVPQHITAEMPAPDLSEGVSIHFDTSNASVQIEGLYEVDEVELPESVTQDLSNVSIIPPSDMSEMFDEADVPGDSVTGENEVVPVVGIAAQIEGKASPASTFTPSGGTPLSGSFLAPDFPEAPVGATTTAFCPHCYETVSSLDVICPHCGEAI